MKALLARDRIFWKLVAIQHAVTVPLTVSAIVLVAVFSGIPFPTTLLLVFLVAFCSSLACTLTAFSSASQVSQAVHDIRDVLERASDGDHAARVPRWETGLLAPLESSANQMQENLWSRFAELQTSRDQLRTVLDSMAEGVIAVDRDQKVLLVNHSVCRMFRFQEQGALGRPIYELIRNPRLHAWVSQAVQQSEPIGGELEIVGAASKHMAIRVASVATPSAAGAVVVISDVSELRRLAGVRQEFVANASHELKTPLASISACVETLIDGACDDLEARQHFLGTIHEQAARLGRLVQDMLALTRIESEGLQCELHAVDLERVVATCQQRHLQNSLRKGIELRVVPAAVQTILWADEEALEQILDNLLDNAIKYTNGGGNVSLRWHVEGDHCLIDVEDTGIGIPQSQLNRIFERFYRVDRARSRELGGTGLGLSIVKHMAQALDGSVSVTSRLGKGTLFSVRLHMHKGPVPQDLVTTA